MDAILLLSHGSLLCGAGETLQAVAERLRARGDAPIVEVGYLNYSHPTFETAFGECVERGATCIVVVPYFLVAGKFVQVDVPRRIAAACSIYPGIEVTVAGALGFHPLLAEAVIASATNARLAADWHETGEQIARVCRADPACPRYGTGACPAGRSAGLS
jgi:sirohydrochlorin cobaltochelatase